MQGFYALAGAGAGAGESSAAGYRGQGGAGQVTGPWPRSGFGGAGAGSQLLQPQSQFLQQQQQQQRQQFGARQQGGQLTPAMALLEAHAKIMKARQTNLALKQELGRRIMSDNQLMRQQQQQQFLQQQQQQQPPLLDHIGQLEKALAELTNQPLRAKDDSAAAPGSGAALPPGPGQQGSKFQQTAAPAKAAAEERAEPQSARPTARQPTAAPPQPPTATAQPPAAPSSSAAAPAPAPAPRPKPKPPAPTQAQAQASEAPLVDTRKLADLASKMAADVEENLKALAAGKGGPGAGAGEGEGGEEDGPTRASQEEAKQRIRKLMKRAERHHQKMPLWRHKLKGVSNPPPEAILKGKALLRVVVKAVIVILLRPMLLTRRLRAKVRDKEEEDFDRDLKAYIDHYSGLVGKQVKVPLSSLEHDTSLDLDLRGLRGEALKQRVMQLKVRVKGIVTCLVEQELPPLTHYVSATGASLTAAAAAAARAAAAKGESESEIEEHDNPLITFLLRLIEDGNYFPPSYLTETERAVLDFDKLGGTSRMLVAADDKEHVPVLPPAVADSWGGTGTMKRVEVMLGAAKSRKVDATRAKVVLASFVLFRVLIGQVVLSPWNRGVCRRPKRRTVTVANNCRMVGSALYLMLQHLDPAMPNLARSTGTGPGLGPGLGAAAVAVPAAAAEGAAAPATAAATATATAAATAAQATPDPAAAAATAAAAAAAAAAAGSPRAPNLVLSPAPAPASAATAATAASAASAAQAEAHADDVIAQYLIDGPNPLPLLEPAQAIRSLLLPAADLAHCRALLGEWLPEQAARLETWLRRFLDHLLAARAGRGASYDDELEAMADEKKRAGLRGRDRCALRSGGGLGRGPLTGARSGRAALGLLASPRGGLALTARSGVGAVAGAGPGTGRRPRPGTRERLPPPTPLASARPGGGLR